MIKTLQKKFIMTAMLAITILLVVLLGVINVVNVLIVSHETDDLMSFLSDTHAGQIKMPPNRFYDHKGVFEHKFSKDDLMSAVYFTVSFDDHGEISSIDISRISSVTESEAQELAIQAYNGKESGNIGRFKYTSTFSENFNKTTYIFLDVSSKYASIARIVGLSLVVGIICWLLMLLLVFFLSKKAIQPIAENLQKQRQFVTDAGHEIKTPIAIILANTDALELRNGETKWSKNIRSQVVRLNGLMQNLLTLARADEINKIMNPQQLNLAEMLETSVAFFEEPMKAKSLLLKKQIENDTVICANKEQISNLLSILIDNAVKYSVTRGTIEIRLTVHEKRVELHIENECEQLPACKPTQLFDRFYRADTARTQKSGGYGIGLSAAQAIVHSHHGEIKAQYSGQNKIAFIVSLHK